MRTAALALLVPLLFSGCLTSEFHVVNEMATTLEAVNPGCEPSVTFDEFAADARNQITHVEVRFDGETRALPFDDAGDVIQQALLVLYDAHVDERLAAAPAGERLDADRAALRFAAANGTLLPNMYDACHPQWSNQRVHFLLVEDNELDLQGDLLTCDDDQASCSVRHSERDFGSLREHARSAFDGVTSL